MRKRFLLRKELIIGVVLLSVGISIVPSTAYDFTKLSQSILEGRTYYVGGSGPNNYSVIQYAVDNASDGDMVFVYRGAYNDYFPTDPTDYHCCVTIHHSINLIGENKNETILNGSGRYDVVSIQANQVTVSGFTMQHGGTPGSTLYGRGIHISGYDNVRIHNNIIRENKLGFFIYYYVENLSIFDNIIQDNQQGIDIEIGPTFVEVYHNVITNNANGIILNYNVSSCSIYENTIYHNGIGVSLETLSDNIIEYNQIEGNSLGVSAYNSKGIIRYNNFFNNTDHAYFSKGVVLLGLPLISWYNQQWNNNYWDDWTTNNSRPIKGHLILYITLWIIHFPNLIPIEIKVGELPFFQYDKYPAQEPF